MKVMTPFFLATTLLMAASPWTANANSIRPVLALTGGAAFVSGLDSSSDFPIGLSQYDYDGQNDSVTRATFGGLIGVEFFATKDWNIQTGIAYYHLSNLSTQGSLTQGFDPESSDQLNYHYTIDSNQVLLETKLLLSLKERFHPYASLGLGAAFNDAEDYKAGSDECLFTPYYEDASKTVFSYTLGLGIDYDLHEHIRLGLGYRFTDLGKAQLGRGELADSAIPEKLNAVHLYAQEVIAQFTFILS